MFMFFLETLPIDVQADSSPPGASSYATAVRSGDVVDGTGESENDDDYIGV